MNRQTRETAIRATRILFAEVSSEETASDLSQSTISEEIEASDLDVDYSNQSESEKTDSENPDSCDLFISSDGTVWSKTPVLNVRSPGRITPANLLRERAGPRKHIADKCFTPVEALSCFFTNEMLEIIIRFTNEEGNKVYSEDWIHLDYVELNAFLGF